MHFSPLRHTKTGIERCNDIIFYVYFSMRCFKTANLQFWRAEERPSMGFVRTGGDFARRGEPGRTSATGRPSRRQRRILARCVIINYNFLNA